MLKVLSDSEIESCIGEFKVAESKKAIVFIGGIHGNEPTGVVALQSVVSKLNEIQDQLIGDCHAWAGNIAALNQEQRYIDRDLNRIWNAENIEKIESGEIHEKNASHEWLEFIRLHKMLKNLMAEGKKLFIVDLHTTSSPSKPFITLADNKQNRKFSKKFPVPTVLGIDQYLKGPLLSYMSDQGYISMAFEAGQHEDPSSVMKHESFIWMALVNAGIIAKENVPEYEVHAETLATKNSLRGRFFYVRYRWAVEPDDRFEMKAGYKNFKKIKKGEVLASDKKGSIQAPKKGRIFMPLYQKSGEDGFFIVKRLKK